MGQLIETKGFGFEVVETDQETGWMLWELHRKESEGVVALEELGNKLEVGDVFGREALKDALLSKLKDEDEKLQSTIRGFWNHNECGAYIDRVVANKLGGDAKIESDAKSIIHLKKLRVLHDLKRMSSEYHGLVKTMTKVRC